MRTVSLFSGAGGLDIGFIKSGFDIIWANDFDKDACASYRNNIGNYIREGDINIFRKELSSLQKVDLIIGGPPCQGFSVAGKMNPDDPRSKHIWTFAETVEKIKPRAFVMENVKALGKLEKWNRIRNNLLIRFRRSGYATNFVIVNASDFEVPQSRERVFFIGFNTKLSIIPNLEEMLDPYKVKSRTVRQVLEGLDKAGEGNNKSFCNAKITLATNPILRRSPYAGMLFNGLGRPLRLDGYSGTLSASMGGNKTPIIDDNALIKNEKNWVETYHEKLWGNKGIKEMEVPKSLRRITVEEAALLQTFPKEYQFYGSQSSRYKQIGNAVPCNLAYNIGRMIADYLKENTYFAQLIGEQIMEGVI